MAKRVLKRRSKVNIPICAAAVLLCLTMFSAHLTGGIYARYSTTASGSDSARVIKFGQLTLTDETKTPTITVGSGSEAIEQIIVIPGVPIDREVLVSFDGSESATYVFLEVVVEKGGDDWSWTTSDQKTFETYFFDHDHDGNVGTDPVPGLSWTVADGWEYLCTEDNKYVYGYLHDPADVNAPLPPNAKLTNVPCIKGNTILVRSEISATELQDICDGTKFLAANFSASVVQKGNFASAAAAWSSLNP